MLLKNTGVWMVLLAPLVLAALAACGQYDIDNEGISSQSSQVRRASGLSPMSEGWHEGAVFMEIYLRGYKDSNGDGIGDFNGLTEQLDYLAALGIRGIWLMPINLSSDRDHGYMVENYRELETEYGSREDFLRLLDEAHKRNIGIVMDYLVNHASVQNPIFKAAAADKDSPLRDWFIWSDTALPWTGHFDHSSWHPNDGEFYYGAFSGNMPDFNLLNPEVIRFHQNNLRYWLNLGVDGFRFDAVSSLVENGKDAWKSQPENHAVVNTFKKVINEEYENRFLICEEDKEPALFAQEDSCGSTFAFGLNYALFNAIKEKNTSELEPFLRDYPLQKMGIILANHDSFAGDRPFVQLDGDLNKYRAVAATQLLLPGRPFIYYGEEIGIARSPSSVADHGIRPPMSWTAEGGFTTARKPFRPHATNLASANVEDQLGQPFSLLTFYHNVIALRNGNFALRLGDISVLDAQQNLVFSRAYFGQEALVAINYSGAAAALALPASKAEYRILYSSEGRKSWDISMPLLPYEVLVLAP